MFRFQTIALGSLALLSACASDPPPPAHPLPHESFLAFAQRVTPPPAAPNLPTAAPPLPLDETFPRLFAETRGFKLGAPRNMHPTEDGKIVFFLRAKPKDARQSLWELDVASNQEHELLSPDALDTAAENLSHEERARRERMRITTSGFTAFEATKDGARAVVTLSGRLFVWTRGKDGARELKVGSKTGASAAVDPHLSPDGTRVAYVRDADIYAISLDGTAREERITAGGTEKKTHGLAEFIAQEELGRSRGFWWSPDGKNILYEESDTSKVETLYIQDPAHPERVPDANPYPRAGTTNATLRFGITSAHGLVGGGATKWIAYDDAKYPYVATVTWTKNASPTFYALDRAQRTGLLFTTDPRSGKIATLLEEHDAAWLNVDSSVPKWLDDGSAFLWSTEKDGTWQLELHDKSGALSKAITKPEDGYRQLLAVDSKTRAAYIEASNEPSEQTIVRVSLDAAGPKTIVGGAGKFISGTFGDSLKVFAVRGAFLDEMPHFGVMPVDGEQQLGKMAAIQSLSQPPPVIPKVEIVRVGNDQIRVAIVRPHNDVHGSRIPLIDAAYGGPGYNVVVSDMSTYLRAQWIADVTGAMVVSIDAQGTPGRGRAWERALLDKMGDVPLDGHVEAIEALEKRFPEIDASRIGIYGWSFGGYLSAYAALKRPDIYRVAVIGAPPADWRDYDTCYTERYLGTPQDDKAGYDNASLLTLAEKPWTMTPASMLIVQGTADDNVYFLNSLKLTSALATGKRPYSFVPVPGVTHMLYTPDTSGPIWVQIASFMRVHLAEMNAQ
ncbi:MAG: DPP IV N-terminal domain-containing protein [Polyangiaceae bacterium]